MNGVINVLKPSLMTSHDVVSFIRRTLNIRKVGHTGTLDPNAAGVLPICIGKGTKLSQYLIEKTKKYRAELTLGYETDTQDKYGKVINKSSIEITENDIQKAFELFKGDIKQIPPMYSAIKHQGKKLYELAREGKTIERSPRNITIYDLSIIQIKENRRVIFDVECSKGTYIRTLCNDIGNKLNTFGVMSFLLRTEVENFTLENSYTLEEISELSQENKIHEILLPLDYPLNKYQSIYVPIDEIKILTNGGKVVLNQNNIKFLNNTDKNIYKVYCGKQFIGMGNIIDAGTEKILKMEKVLV